MNLYKRIIGHTKTVMKHRREVRKLCFKCGLYWQGLTHDLSKYSTTEFINGVRFFTGTASPHNGERKAYGYSKAWLHHKAHNKLQANCYTGVRHDSGDPFLWATKMINHYKSLGIDPKTKTLLFSDGLNFDKAQDIYNCFKDEINISFGIGTYLSNDTDVDALNIVIKLQYVNGHPVAKLSDDRGKAMCQNPEYFEYLKNAVDYRVREGI